MTAMGQSWSWQGKPSSGNHRMEKPQWYKNFPPRERDSSIDFEGKNNSKTKEEQVSGGPLRRLPNSCPRHRSSPLVHDLYFVLLVIPLL
jgi:hypothetical protein